MKEEIIYVDYGIACTDVSRNKIYINKMLVANKDILNKVLVHERKHATGMYTLKDLLLDLKPDLNLFWYTLRHPKMLTSLLPCHSYDGIMYINLLNSLLWLIIIFEIIIFLKWI